MAYDASKPANDGFIADAPAEIRANTEGLRTGQVVDAGTLKGLSPGNASGNIPVSNGTLNINLNADKVDGLDASAFAAANHSHTTVTTSTSGFMSNTDKSKLDGIATGAQVNQMAFSNVLVGGTTIQADAAVDTLELVAGNNIVLTPDATNDRVTIGVTGTVATAATAGTCTGNAATATAAAKLATARTIGMSGKVTGTATSFDGSGNVVIPVTAVTADNCTGNSATATAATKLATARTISLTGDVTGATSFDGTGNVAIATTVTAGMPLGFTFAMLANNPPSGCLALQGALVSRSAYPDLWAWVQANAPLITETAWQAQAAVQSSVGAYSSGDGSTSFRLPKVVDFVRGSDTGRGPGAWQADALQNVIGQFGAKAAGNHTPTGPFYSINPISGGSSDSSAPGPELIGFDLSRAVRTTDETRPKSISMLWCVKAFGAVTNQGVVDITALAASLNDKIGRIDVGYGIQLWVSEEYIPVRNSLTSVNHGIVGLNPLYAQGEVILRCIVAEHGYSVGDYAISWGADHFSLGVAAANVNLTKTTIQYTAGNGGTGIMAAHKTTGAPVALTLANWRYIFRIRY